LTAIHSGYPLAFNRRYRRRSVLKLTPGATGAIEGILKAPGIPEGAGIRIAAAAPTNSAAAASELQVTVAAEPDDSDQLIEEEGARVFVEDTSPSHCWLTASMPTSSPICRWRWEGGRPEASRTGGFG
jgi:iron-sulfur cluster assembly protein